MEDLVIPELEEAKRKVTWRPWTPEEEAGDGASACGVLCETLSTWAI